MTSRVTELAAGVSADLQRRLPGQRKTQRDKLAIQRSTKKPATSTRKPEPQQIILAHPGDAPHRQAAPVRPANPATSGRRLKLMGGEVSSATAWVLMANIACSPDDSQGPDGQCLILSQTLSAGWQTRFLRSAERFSS